MRVLNRELIEFKTKNDKIFLNRKKMLWIKIKKSNIYLDN